MCALTIAPPSSSSDPRNGSSWAARAARVRVERPPDMQSVPLSFRDLRVGAEDVTTVSEAFAHCSAESLLNAVMRHEAGWRIPVDSIGSRAHHMLMGKIANALDAMRSLEDAVAALSPSREGIVGPLFRFAAAEGGVGLEHRVEVAVLSADDAIAIEERFASGMKRVCTWDALRALRRAEESPSVSDRLTPESLHASHAILARMPWERVLALPLWLPSDLSEDEQQAILARIFWSMTYCGFMQVATAQGAPHAQSQSEVWQHVQVEPAPWPVDPVLAVLDHNCWVDTLEAWNALFAVMRPRETRP